MLTVVGPGRFRIFRRRFLSDSPTPIAELGEEMGISPEWIEEIEDGLLEALARFVGQTRTAAEIKSNLGMQVAA